MVRFGMILFGLATLLGPLGCSSCDAAVGNPSETPPPPLDAPLDWLNVSDAGQASSNSRDSSVAPAINPVSDGGAIQAGITDAGVDEDVCVALSATADNVVLPVDIIWVIDSSPSMDDSILIIEENLNAFVEDISSSNLDYHVVLIGSEADNYDPVMTHQYLGICIPEPLSGAPGCPDTDSDRYRHIRVGVHSHDALSKVINNYDAYKDFLREDAIAHFVAVTDDDTGGMAGASEFNTFIASATQPGFPQGFTFHSVVDLVGYIEGCFWDDECSCGENRGQPYIDLSEETNGIVQSICQDDWTEVFEALKENVIEGALLPCEYALPELDNNLQVDPDATNVVLISTEDGTRTTLPNVFDASECEGNQAWFFDRPNQPTRAVLCGAACGLINTTIELEFGCETVKYPQ